MNEPLKFSERDLLRYELAQERLTNSQQAARLIDAEQERVKAEFERALNICNASLQRLESERLTIQQQAHERRLALLALQQELESSYGIDLQKLSYDQQTGQIYPLNGTAPSAPSEGGGS